MSASDCAPSHYALASFYPRLTVPTSHCAHVSLCPCLLVPMPQCDLVSLCPYVFPLHPQPLCQRTNYMRALKYELGYMHVHHLSQYYPVLWYYNYITCPLRNTYYDNIYKKWSITATWDQCLRSHNACGWYCVFNVIVRTIHVDGTVSSMSSFVVRYLQFLHSHNTRGWYCIFSVFIRTIQGDGTVSSMSLFAQHTWVVLYLRTKEIK